MPKDTDTPLAADKLDEIALYLRRMDRRDRLRTWGGIVHGIISIIPVALLLISAWYVYAHGDELLTKITKQAAKEAATMTQDQSEEFMNQFQQYFQ